MATAAPRPPTIAAPPLAPTGEAVDFAHLARMTLGERELEREVLALFEQQAGMLLARMRGGDRAAAVCAAHTLKGSARSIGAWQVALAAEAVELSDAATRTGAIEALSGAIAAARIAIARRLSAN